MSEKVTVRISGSQRVTYSQEVEMSKAEFDRLDQALDSTSSNREAQKIFDEIESLFIDSREICSADDFELDDFCIVGGDQ